LKPAQVLDGLVRPPDGFSDGVLDGGGGSAGEFNEFIDWVFHSGSLLIYFRDES
jgi:hypothetical protein